MRRIAVICWIATPVFAIAGISLGVLDRDFLWLDTLVTSGGIATLVAGILVWYRSDPVFAAEIHRDDDSA